MPFQMIYGRNGRVLAAILPVERGSYVEVRTFRTTLRLLHPQGVVINKWPAIVPDFDSLSEHTRQTIDQLREKALENLLVQYRQSSKGEPSPERVRAMKDWVNRPMTCVNVKIGRPLVASLPPKPFKHRGRFDFGTITAITIYNLGKAPVSVESSI